MTPEIRYLNAADYRLFSEIRLAALRSEPDAFGELYENVAGRTPADWKGSTCLRINIPRVGIG
jgi:hypothetical protein